MLHVLLYALLCHLQCDMYSPIASRICCKHSKFYSIQRGAGIAVCNIGQKICRILRDICIIWFYSPFRLIIYLIICIAR